MVTKMPSYSEFFLGAYESSLIYVGNYDPVLVGLSVIVAIFASYAALVVSQHITSAHERHQRQIWLATGGVCLGLGIWAMHFVGMLAFALPCSSSYDFLQTMVSTIPGMLVSMLALNTISHRQISPLRLGTGGLLLGAGIGAMHYSGMAAMRLDGIIRYDLKLFLLSIVVAVLLATLALWIKFRLLAWRIRSHVPPAIVMGLAVAGMHYTAMAAANFIRDGSAGNLGVQLSPKLLAAVVLVVTSVIIVITIVATYVEKHKLFSFERSYRLVALLIVAWIMIASVCADKFHQHQLDQMVQTESQQAQRQVDSVAANLSDSLNVLKAIPQFLARNEETRRILRQFGPAPVSTALDYETRKRAWSKNRALHALDLALEVTAFNFKADAVWIVNASGDCVAASNALRLDSFVGSTFSDRDYFLQARAGNSGHQYAIGRASKLPGLYFSVPVIEQGRFLGAAVVKRNISAISSWFDRAGAFLSDENGVIVAAPDQSFMMRALPNALINDMAAERRQMQYQTMRFDPLLIAPVLQLPGVFQIGGSGVPQVLASRTLDEEGITVHLPVALLELAHLDAQRLWIFALIAFTGSTLIVAVSAIVLYLREARRSEADLRVAATAFESQAGMIITDAWYSVLRVNRSFTAITGYSADDVVDQELLIFDPVRHDDAFGQAMWDSVARDGAWQGEIWNRRKNGESYPAWLVITAVRDAARMVSHFVCTLTDITERKASEEEIRNLALYDFLTRLPNRRCLMERLKQALAASANTGRHGALLFIDLDNFKDLNDTLGHNMGDMLLQQTAERFTACVRESDTVARLGGDEFVIMLEDLDDDASVAASRARAVGEKILECLNEPYVLEAHQHSCTSSIGINLFLGYGEDIESLLKQTDLAMYQSKAEGRNTLRFFNPAMQSVATARAALDSDLRQALQLRQFTLYYQAQVDDAGRLTGAEALLRWQHPERGMVPPNEFIGAAEESGLILALGHWVLETACAQLLAWSALPAMRHLSVSINVSPRQFRQHDFVGQVMTALANSGAAPHKLRLELTENLLLDDIEETIAKMSRLKRQGIRIALDDFGTGYSSLAYLKRLPICQLKIDRSFVRDILDASDNVAIVRTILTLANSIGLEAIAEGVETERQRTFLLSQGCRAFQGYLFGRPETAAQFEHRATVAAQAVPYLQLAEAS